MQEQRSFKFLGTLIVANTLPWRLVRLAGLLWFGTKGAGLGFWAWGAPSSLVPPAARTPTCRVPDLEVQGFPLYLQVNGEPLKHSGGVALRKKGARQRL